VRARAFTIGIGASVLFAVACLPDLVLTESAPDAGAPVCGDGRIDPTAGEECDPGGAPAAGCASCKVQCEDGGGVDPASLHCYFQAGQVRQFSQADQETCGAAGGHVVTFASESEASFVATRIAKTDPYWVGLVLNAATRAYEPTIPFEPGWSAKCPGCYAHLDAGADTLPLRSAGITGQCVIGERDTTRSWFQSPCAGFNWAVVCEREPAGSRAEFCGGAVCITVPKTFGAKRYVFVPERVSAAEAAEACASELQGRLVHFDSPEEREQLAHEIATQTAVAVAPPEEFWIGLSNGAAGTWQWDDGKSRPAPWGIAPSGPEPIDAGPSARAFVRIQTGSVDSELAHAGNASPDGGDLKPFVCEH
jgi:hypothetical protein